MMCCKGKRRLLFLYNNANTGYIRNTHNYICSTDNNKESGSFVILRISIVRELCGVSNNYYFTKKIDSDNVIYRLCEEFLIFHIS